MNSKVALWLILLLGVLSVTPVIAAGPNGKELFNAHCLACHREDGEGSIGLPLLKGKFSTLSDSYLFKTIRNGRLGRIMPAFEKLSDAQVKAIVGYLRDWSGTSSFEYPEVVSNGNIEHGKKLFAGYCANCHGETGEGLGKGTGQSYSRERDFKVVPPAVNNIGFLNSTSDGMLREVIQHGRKGTLMAAFSKLGLSEQDIDDVIVYLRAQQRQDSTQAGGEENMLMPDASITFDSPNDFDTTLENLKQALSGNNYRVFPDRYLEKGLFPEWQVNKKLVTVRYCNFNQLYEILTLDPRVGVGLPCRITVVEHEDGRVQLIAMNMALIARLFNNDQLRAYAQELNNVQLQILEEVTF